MPTTTSKLARVQYTVRFGGLKVEVDSNEVYPEDPGNGTPVMVSAPGGHSATIGCALGEGEVEGYQLSQQESDWLQEQSDRADRALAPFWRA